MTRYVYTPQYLILRISTRRKIYVMQYDLEKTMTPVGKQLVLLAFVIY